MAPHMLTSVISIIWTICGDQIYTNFWRDLCKFLYVLSLDRDPEYHITQALNDEHY